MMKLNESATIDDLVGLLEAYLPAAAFRAALELGLFWRLVEGPKSVEEVAELWDIPIRRCRVWLELLAGLNLLERRAAAYALSDMARRQIVETYSQETWQTLAREARERDLAAHNLTRHLNYPGSVWEAQGRVTPNYVAQMVGDAELARRFTQMFHERGRRLAEELAQRLDLADARRLMDLGGGSGVVSLALLRRYPRLTAVVVDLENVCAAGRRITKDAPEADRLSYYAADFTRDPLPEGFDVVLECKVGVYEEPLLHKIAGALNSDGRLIVVDELVRHEGDAKLSRLNYALLNSLQDPDFLLPTTEAVWDQILDTGFRRLVERRLPGGETVLEARRPRS